MENSSPLIFDISSDEEVGFGNVRKGGGCGGVSGGGQFGDMDDCDWLSNLLIQVGGDKNACSDDVVLVSDDAVPNPLKKPRLEPLNQPAAEVIGDESDDDDCVVLDGDPDKQVAVFVAGAAKGNVDGGGDDDLEIVAEKGEVACRDFPHARHLCAKFLFSSTPHQVHCTQCHCYVCDSLAPCSQWGTGISSIDHCHATDKEGYWKTERNCMKRGEKPALPVPINSTSPLSDLLFLPAQVPSLPQPVFHPVTAQSVSQGGLRPSGCAFRPVPVYRPPSQLLAVQARSNVSKPTGSVGASLPNNSHLHVSLSSVNPRKRRLVQQVAVTRTCHPVQQIRFMKDHNHGHQSYLPSHPQVYSRPYLIQTTPPPPIHVNSTNLMCTVPLPTHMVSQPGAGPHLYRPQNFTPSQTVSSHQLDAGIGSELKSKITAMPPIQCTGSKLEINSQTSQPYARSDPSSLFDNLPSVFQQGNHGQNGAINLSSNYFGLALDSQPHGSIENNTDQQGSIENNTDQQKGVVIADNHPSLTIETGSQFPESILHDKMDFLFDNLMFENYSLPVVSEVPVSPLWNNAYSPEPASVDTGNLFDF